MLEAAKLLHIKEHSVIDASETVFKLAAPVECKGIVGSDNRHYLLDLMRVTPRDANYTGPESRFCVLRPELITSFCQVRNFFIPSKSMLLSFPLTMYFYHEGRIIGKIKIEIQG